MNRPSSFILILLICGFPVGDPFVDLPLPGDAAQDFQERFKIQTKNRR